MNDQLHLVSCSALFPAALKLSKGCNAMNLKLSNGWFDMHYVAGTAATTMTPPTTTTTALATATTTIPTTATTTTTIHPVS
jgi:hypothetical protein